MADLIADLMAWLDEEGHPPRPTPAVGAEWWAGFQLAAGGLIPAGTGFQIDEWGCVGYVLTPRQLRMLAADAEQEQA